MGTVTIEQVLVATQPVQPGSLSAFTSRTMRAVKRSAQYRAYKKRPRRITGFGWLLRLSPIAFAAVVVAIVAAAATTTYAIFLLWGKPAAHLQETGQNQFGRQQAVINFENCKYFKRDSAMFEVKAGVTLDQPELEKIASARCERDQIVNWVSQTWPLSQGATRVERGETVVIENITATTLSFYDSMHQQHLTLPILTDSRVIIEGADHPLSELKQGDVVVVAVASTFPPGGHGPAIKREVQAIIKLSLPFEYYTSKQTLLTERKPCTGNPQSSCLSNNGLHLYPHFNHNTKQATPETIWEIQGKLVGHTAHSLTLQGSGGEMYVTHTPFDIVNDHNQHWKSTYKNTTVELGDTIAIQYTQPASADHKNIADDEIQYVTLLAEQQIPAGTWVKY